VELVAAVELLVAEAELLERVEGVEELVERMAVVGVVEEEEEGWEELEAGEEEPAPLLEVLSLCAHKTKLETVCDDAMSWQTRQAAVRLLVDVSLQHIH